MDAVGLSPAVREALEYCIQKRYCTAADLDSKIVAIFQSLPDEAALRVLTEFTNADIGSVRSPTGYMVGIIRKLGLDSTRLPTRRYYDSGRLQPNWRQSSGQQRDHQTAFQHQHQQHQQHQHQSHPIAKRPRPNDLAFMGGGGGVGGYMMQGQGQGPQQIGGVSGGSRAQSRFSEGPAAGQYQQQQQYQYQYPQQQ